MNRKAKISRKTKETSINIDLNIDGRGKYKIDTGIGFLNHMLEQLSKHSSMDLIVKAKGDTHIDFHHTTEDTGIAIGACLKKASNLLRNLSVRQSFASSTAALVRLPACFSNFASSLSNNVSASAVDPANPAITFLFSIFLTFVAVLLTTVLPILTCPSPATTTSLFFLTRIIVVPCHLMLSLIIYIVGYEF